MPDSAPVPPDVLARAVAVLNANKYGGRSDWRYATEWECPSVVNGHDFHLLEPIEAVAVAVYRYWMDDPREKGADR
jgi:hypothetical protein